MSKRTSKPKVFAFDAKDKATRIKAERLEIHLGKGRKLLLSFPGSAWGDLEVEAETDSDEVVPLLSLQPGACNLLTLRVDLDHDLRPVEAMDLPQHDSPPMLTLKVQKAVEGADKTNSPKKHSIRRWAQAALQQDVKVVVRLVGEAEGQALNREYRGKDYATNVLTFVYGEGEAMPGANGQGMPLTGDLVLCVPVLVREAAEQGKTLDAHFAHMVVHGMLHLQGYEHEQEGDAQVMEKAETEILRSLGYADPYA